MKVLVSFGLRPIENGFFNESLFLVSGLLKMYFSMKVFVFLVSSLVKMDFSMRMFVVLVLGIVEDGAVPFFHLNL